MRRRADPRRCHVDLLGIGTGVGDKFGDCRGRNRRVHDQHHGYAGNGGHRRDVAHKFEVQFWIQRSVDRVRRADEQQRVAVRRGARHEFCREVGARPGARLDDKRLPEPLRQRLCHEAGYDVGRAPCGISEHPAHRARRIVLRIRRLGHGRQSGATGHLAEELSSRVAHWCCSLRRGCQSVATHCTLNTSLPLT